MGSKILLSRKKCRFQKNFKSKKFLGKKKFGSKKMFDRKKLRFQRIFGSKKILGPKNYAQKIFPKMFGSNTISGKTNIWFQQARYSSRSSGAVYCKCRGCLHFTYCKAEIWLRIKLLLQPPQPPNQPQWKLSSTNLMSSIEGK